MADVKTNPIVVTESAIKKIRSLLAEQPEGSFLRVGVRGGGCSGLSYTLGFERTSGPHDEIVEISGVKLLIDPKSALYLQGMTLEFVEGLTGGGFKFQNPNAKISCGCGESFSA